MQLPSILVVADDQRNVRGNLKMILEAAGYELAAKQQFGHRCV